MVGREKYLAGIELADVEVQVENKPLANHFHVGGSEDTLPLASAVRLSSSRRMRSASIRSAPLARRTRLPPDRPFPLAGGDEVGRDMPGRAGFNGHGRLVFGGPTGRGGQKQQEQASQNTGQGVSGCRRSSHRPDIYFINLMIRFKAAILTPLATPVNRSLERLGHRSASPEGGSAGFRTPDGTGSRRAPAWLRLNRPAISVSRRIREIRAPNCR
jgi:hypothetical protein